MKKLMKTITALAMTALMVLGGTGTAYAAGTAKQADTSAVSQSVNELNWKLFDKMTGEDNLFYSAYSIDSAFAMMDAGAKNNTKKQMEKVLGISDIDAFLDQYNAYRTKKMPRTCKLNTANGIWINTDKIPRNGINKGYQLKMKIKMGATVKAEPFTDNTSREVTQFVNKTTKGFLPDYQSIVTPDKVMDLVNAVYFYGEWETPFDTNDTNKQMFYGNAKPKRVDMMHAYNNNYRYLDNGTFKAIQLPYQDGKIVMDVILPSGNGRANNVADLWTKTSAKNREAFLQNLDGARMEKIRTLALPKIELDQTTDSLPQILQSLGMTDAFGGNADFTGIAPNLYIDSVRHRAKVSVDEKGTKAAAVTEIAVGLTAMAPEEERYIDFIADHPFIFVIRDQSNGAELFTGAIHNLT
ncbi:MAG: serpin family protein [Oscillospiraceae bacterium]|nr:serpin family protein [Oscillospiraceae bacterium]